MKADFEKGTKVCSRCRKELPLNMFYKNITMNDGFSCYCKECHKMKNKRNDSVFNRNGRKRGNTGMLKRDYELTKEQLEIRKRQRKRACSKRNKKYGMLTYYSGDLNEVSKEEYEKIMIREYSRQKYCAIRGYIAIVNPYEHFLFDFDLEQMIKDGMTDKHGNTMKRWWKGEIRHWTVKDGIWKE